MNFKDANEQVGEPSTPTEQDASREVDQTTQPNAESSAAPDAKPEKDLLSVVRDVVQKSRSGQAPASSAESPESGEVETGEPKKLDDVEYTDVPFHKHPRFQKVLQQKKAFEQDAVRYRNVTDYLDRSGLSSDEAADGLSIMGLAKTNPAEAWQRIRPWVQKLLIAAGEVIPQDLHQRVQQGELNEMSAVELSRARAQANSMQEAQRFHAERAQRQAQEQHSNSLVDAAQQWDEDRRLKDPNYEAKIEAIQKEIAFLHYTKGKPTTPEGVRAQLSMAYTKVNQAFAPPKPPTPPKPAIRPVTGGQVAGNAAPASMSTLDIIRARRRGG